MIRKTLKTVALAGTAAMLAATVSAQMMPRNDSGPLGRLATLKEALSPPASTALLDQANAGIAPNGPDAWGRFQSEAGGTWVGYIDRRSGYLEFAEGSGWPWIPGAGNNLSDADIASFLGASGAVDLATMDRVARAFFPQVSSLLGVEAKDLKLSEGRSGPMSDYLWYVDYDVYRGGWKIEDAHVMFRINHGNLVQFGTDVVHDDVRDRAGCGGHRQQHVNAVGGDGNAIHQSDVDDAHRHFRVDDSMQGLEDGGTQPFWPIVRIRRCRGVGVHDSAPAGGAR